MIPHAKTGRRAARTILQVVVLLALACASLPWGYSVARANGPVVRVVPASQDLPVGGVTTVDIRIEAVADLYGADVRLSFDPAKLKVQDANTAVAGIQVHVGTFPDPTGGRGFVVLNSADNIAGQIAYAVTLLSPASPVSGSGVLARVTFQAIGEGTSPIAFTSAALSNPQANPIAVTTEGGQITVTPGPTPTPTPPPTPPPPCGKIKYVVRWGDTLSSIALRFGTTVGAIVALNNIPNPNYIWVGQVLCIPCAAAPPPSGQWYIVQPGDNLYRIALKFNTTVDAIVRANNILNPWYIWVGQRLFIPSGWPTPPPGRTYVVQLGDTLFAIALRYGTTVWAIVLANNIPNPNLIYVGQVLVIP